MLDFSTLQAFADKVLGMVKIVTFASKQLEIFVGKEKMLVTIFFFNVLNNLLFQDCCNSGLKCIAFNPFPNKPWFLCVCSTSLFIDIATKLKQFLLFPQCFQLVWKTFCHLHQTQKLSSANSEFGRV